MLASLKTKLPMAEIVLPTWIGLLVGIAYYFGAMVGFALTLPNHSVSTLWPPNSIMRNAKGVTIVILQNEGKESGTRFSLGPSGVNLKLK